MHTLLYFRSVVFAHLVIIGLGWGIVVVRGKPFLQDKNVVLLRYKDGGVYPQPGDGGSVCGWVLFWACHRNQSQLASGSDRSSHNVMMVGGEGVLDGVGVVEVEGVVDDVGVVDSVMVDGVSVAGDSVSVGGSLNDKGLPRGDAVRGEYSGCTPVRSCTRGVGDGIQVPGGVDTHHAVSETAALDRQWAWHPATLSHEDPVCSV